MERPKCHTIAREEASDWEKRNFLSHPLLAQAPCDENLLDYNPPRNDCTSGWMCRNLAVRRSGHRQLVCSLSGTPLGAFT